MYFFLYTFDYTSYILSVSNAKKRKDFFVIVLTFFDLDFNQRRMKVDEVENGTDFRSKLQQEKKGKEGVEMKPDHVSSRSSEDGKFCI